MVGRYGRCVAAIGGVALLLWAGAALSEVRRPDQTATASKAAPAGGTATTNYPATFPAKKDASAPSGREADKWTDRVQALSAVAQAITAVFVTLFTGFLAWLSWRQYKLEIRLAAENGNALDIARKSAEAALLSARVSEAAIIGGPRPMLAVEWTDYSPAVPEPNSPTASHPVEIAFAVTNCGERNAIIESFYVEVLAGVREADTMWPAPSAERLASPENIMADNLAPWVATVLPRAVYPAKYTGYVSMEDEELQSMWGLGRRRLIMLILITYRDPFNVRRERGLTLFYSPLAKSPNQWDRLESPRYDFDRVVDLGDLDFGRQRGSQAEQHA